MIERVINLAIALIVGLLAGTHTATWGMYKDALYEGFSYRKYFRSILLSSSIAIGLQSFIHFDLTRAANLIILFGVTYVIERGINEFYKTFINEEDQSKYTIPMQFSIGGKVVENRSIRWLVGLLYFSAVSLIIFGVYSLQQADLNLPGLAVLLLIGSIGGWISAIGGAWKDAPIEGFETLKFFRSPVIALFYALIIACFTDNYLYIGMGGLAYTIATSESYKTFLQPNEPRGKFAGKEIKYPEMFEQRKPYAFLFYGIWLTLILTAAIAFIQPHEGLI
jgi:hypothetical protein